MQLPRFDVQPNDAFICSWPRSGNTWLRCVMYYALHPDASEQVPDLDQWMPMMDESFNRRTTLKRFEGQSHRLLKSHDGYLPYMLKGKVVYIIRDGRDATVSLYNYRMQMKHVDLPFSDFLKNVISEKYRFGSWHKHVASWLPHLDHPNVLEIRYEQMLQDMHVTTKRVFEHIGMTVSDQQINHGIERANYANMNKLFQVGANRRGRTFQKAVGGRSGGWRKYFTQDDLDLFMHYASQTMNDVGYDITLKVTDPSE